MIFLTFFFPPVIIDEQTSATFLVTGFRLSLKCRFIKALQNPIQNWTQLEFGLNLV